MNHRRYTLPVVALALAFLAGSCGDDDGTPSSATPTEKITIEDPWVRATSGTEDPSMTAAFMVIDNDGSEDITLVDASSPVSDMVQLHEMAMVDGEMAMQEVDGGIVITAGRGKLLEPGGYHVMLMGLDAELAPGDEVELTLEFSDDTREVLTVPVKEFTEEEGHYHAPGTEDHADEPSHSPSSS
ncbi:MAG: copper chaperone PCu(A)C [Nocardioides sp.]|nr:copper chaperone PCu(A)C [Nocardioides sp.]